MTSNVSSEPFIKKFRDSGFYYIYDVNTNQIVEVEKSLYDIIGNYMDDKGNRIKNRKKETVKSTDFNNPIEEIKKASNENGLFSNYRPKKITLGIENAEGVKEIHANGLKQIVIEVTRSCTFNCAYCPTSGKYSKSKKFQLHMNKETCKEAVDFFCERSSNYEESIMTFYGGEPLLRFDLIKETVKYVKKKYAGKKFIFNLTTNAVLLNKEILDFFIENDFSVAVSLDGPQQINDRYRRFKNGKGTFKSIMKALKLIKAYNKDYYYSHVSISSVLSPPFNKIDEILDFFSNDNTLYEIKGNISSYLVDTGDTTFIEDFNLEESFKEYSKVFRQFNKRIKKSILDNNLNQLTIEKNRIFNILYDLSRKPIKRLHEHAIPLGACHIGIRRVFVTTNGDFHICERAGYDYKIGCVKKGFDYERIAYYYRKLDEVLEDCKNCWAINHCERCWAVIGNLEKFTGKIKENFCNMNKKIIEKAFKLYVQLLRENPDCLKVFKDVKIG
jgi:uncharacterized protein